jgi:hypothetical protein
MCNDKNKDKDPLFVVDYSKIEDPDEVEKEQGKCEHKTLSILDVTPEILHNKYGVAFKKNIIYYICEDCSKILSKVKK